MKVLKERGGAVGPPDEATLNGRSLADYATDTLRDQLITLEVPPGTPLSDELIGLELGVGRTPIREAIKRLEAEHLIAVYPRRGTFAAGIDITDLAHITELRVQLEPLAAERAALHATDEDRQRMRELATELSHMDLDTANPRHLMQHDLKVHRLIYAANGNPHLAEVLTRYDNLATRIWCLVIERLTNVQTHVGEHTALLTLIADGNASEAARAAREHVVSFERLVRSTI